MSPVALVLDALHELLTAAMPDVTVIHGPRSTAAGPAMPPLVCVGTSLDLDPALVTMDPGYPVDATVGIGCLAEVLISGEREQRAATTAALDLHQAVIGALRAAGETLDAPGVQWARVLGRGQLLPSTSTDSVERGRGAAVLFTVSVLVEV